MPHRVTLRYQHRFEVPVAGAYAWLTDYSDRDPELAGAIMAEERVLHQSAQRTRFTAVREILGKTQRRDVEVVKDPPDRWVAFLQAANGRITDVNRYHLEPLEGGTRCRLTIDYTFHVPNRRLHVLAWLARPWIKRDLGRMWDGYAEAMERELAVACAAAPTAREG